MELLKTALDKQIDKIFSAGSNGFILGIYTLTNSRARYVYNVIYAYLYSKNLDKYISSINRNSNQVHIYFLNGNYIVINKPDYCKNIKFHGVIIDSDIDDYYIDNEILPNVYHKYNDAVDIVDIE